MPAALGLRPQALGIRTRQIIYAHVTTIIYSLVYGTTYSVCHNELSNKQNIVNRITATSYSNNLQTTKLWYS